MGKLQGNKLPSHAAEDHSISADSLSFAGLVSIQDHHPKSPNNNNNNTYYYQVCNNEELDFEFSTIKEDLNSGANPFKITPADVLISNGQIKAFHPNRSFPTDHPPISLGSLLTIDHVKSKMSSGKTRGCDEEQLIKARKHKSKERSVTRTWFGQRVLRSFLSPCRKCKAIQPGATKGRNVPG